MTRPAAKQSAALVVKRDGAGYGGYTDLTVDLRVDDHGTPIAELGRLLEIALVNDLWNRGWTAFAEKRFSEALKWQEETASMAKDSAVFPKCSMISRSSVSPTAIGRVPRRLCVERSGSGRVAR